VAAPFLCSDREELRAFRRRMMLAILVAGVCFAVVPLRFAFPRPSATDWTAPIFNFLHGFDRPYNLFPSLHIAIRTFLADTYGRHSRGVLKAVFHTWFVLIGLSTVFTYQHHVVDVAGGFVLALVCFYLIPERASAQPATTNARVGAMYAGGAALLVAAAVWLRPAGFVLAWPAVSLTIVAGAYFGLYGGITRKRDGRLPWSTRLLLGPWLIGQYASLLYYRRQCRAWDQVTPNVWIGRQLNEREAATAIDAGVTAVLDLTGEFSAPSSFRRVAYLNVPVLDLTAPTFQQVLAAVTFIDAHRGAGVVYVHCKVGYSRSAAVVGAWLRGSGLAQTGEEAVARMRNVRPSIVVRAEVLEVLQ
jgi:protein-tyrosine phosphatase